MASLVLGAVGTAIGGSIGGTFLGMSAATIGGMIGSGLGSVVDSLIVAGMQPNQNIVGQRLETLRVTTSIEGAVLPRVFGRMRIGGQIIWATDFREETRTTSQGGGKGGGGGSVSVTEYIYYASFAVALCEGPIAGVGRIWADGKPFDVPGAVWRVYQGTEDQEPDSWIEAKQGAGTVPAYRGTAYVVFEELPLEKFGNRIPQLSFEVYRPDDETASSEQLITAVNLIPGAGEFVYETARQRDILTETSSRTLNNHAAPDRTDLEVALDQLADVCPNLESVALVVAWFGDDLRAGDCTLRPKVEVNHRISLPHAWSVAGIGRSSAAVVSSFDGRQAFGGTPSDGSVGRAIAAIKARGWRVAFYPFVMMDIPPDNELPDPWTGAAGQPAYPWRGRITCDPAPGQAGSPDKTSAAATQINSFFGSASPGAGEWSYRRMILHYANLCDSAGGVDAFLIGSELRGLTQVRSSASAYPAVTALAQLAADVRAILGAGTAISYAADWSEYFGHHPQDGSGDVYFHLDPLWASANIDFVGIDNYMPLSDWRDGNDHLDAEAGWKSIYDPDYLQSNIEGGEGFDWYYASGGDRETQTRTAITDGEGKPWAFRYKDLRSWWQNAHYNRPGGVESETPTAWAPESKPIWFTEAGCPAIDKGTNQPNVFVDPKSAESTAPYFSRGERDDFIQRRYIESLIGYWSDPDNNPASTEYSGRMIDAANIHIWTWDARPYPYFPGLPDVWSDAENWRLGHWIAGRLGAAGLGSIVRALCRRAGLADGLIDTSLLNATVAGYLIQGIESARASLGPLMRFYAFDAVESDGLIRFVPRGGQPVLEFDSDSLVAAPSRQSDDLMLTRGQETELPLALKWRLLRADEEYNGLTVEARRITVDTARISTESFSIAGMQGDADTRCRRALYEAWLERETAAFRLPPSRLALDPTDIVLLAHDGRFMEFRIASVADGEARGIEAARADAAIHGMRPGPDRVPSLPIPVGYGPPVAALMNLPRLSDDVPAHRPYAAVLAQPWYGRSAIYRSATQDNFELIETPGLPARMGELAGDFYSGPVARFDLANELWVSLYSGQLSSVSDIELFGGANALAVESESGFWEIVQFGEAELVAPGQYVLRRLLRGQLGTESAMRAPAPEGARVVVLDSAVVPLPISADTLGLSFNWRCGPAARTPDDSSYAEIVFAATGVGLRPYSVAHVSQPFRFPRVPGDLEISWVRRTRAASGDSWQVASVPLDEDAEAYEVDIIDGETVLRTLASNQPSVVYTGAQQTADWGAPLGPGDQLAVVVYQISATFGRGAPKAETLFF
ncbi:hypothetical protein F2P47_01430 [Parvibaculum sedimenti]|uniref:Host specificity protein n=1 Tax=Parvibaculum sedimenti TaxID=2608632 RepID=A0A6N6VM20_9HYPH|nr:glycoside hydrolase/phage tail family protein [Parvibaculum sedimenti]KAB7742818.1 hypothetical protein F2P47_01430 [Parvibaculum sedimenti]